ncbi:MAG: polysaccharide biosynthesis [Planctomycetota bacterium]|nr:MAG: polysaccharide biosynthesis [Planctomycetota bacterium]
MVYVFQSSFWMGLAQAFTIAATFAVGVATTHCIKIEKLGDYKLVFAMGAMIGAFSMTGMSVAVTRAAARGEDGALASGFWSNLLWSFPALLVGVPVAAYFGNKGNWDVVWGLAVAVPGILILQSTELAGAFLTGKKNFKLHARFAGLQSGLSSGLLAATLLVTRNIVLLTAVFYASNILIALPIYAWVVRKCRREGTSPDGKAAVNYGKHLSAMNLLGTISFQLDKVLAWQFLGPIPTAIYSFAIAPPQNLRVLGKNLSAISLPKLAEKEPAELKRLVPRKAVVVLVLSIALIAAYVAGAPYIFRWFFPPKYMECVPYSRWYSLVILGFPLVLFQNSLIAHQETRAQYVINTTLPVFKTILYFVLIPKFQVSGIVASILITEILHFVLVLWFFSQMKTPAKSEPLPEIIPATEASL